MEVAVKPKTAMRMAEGILHRLDYGTNMVFGMETESLMFRALHHLKGLGLIHFKQVRAHYDPVDGEYVSYEVEVDEGLKDRLESYIRLEKL